MKVKSLIARLLLAGTVLTAIPSCVNVSELQSELADIKTRLTNLGAENPWEPGNYYAWGELEPKKDYSWATYKWCDGTKDHMPTDSDWRELVNNCTVTWTGNYNGTGIAGSIFTGKKSGYTGVSIFIPAAGMRVDTATLDPGTYCFYWTSVLDIDREPSNACYFMSDESNTDINSYIRPEGRSVRAVCP